MKPRDQLKILLLQIREDEETMLEEFYEFVQYSGCHHDQFTCLNTYKTNTFGPEVIQGFDALFVGGSSDASVLKPEEFTFVSHCRQLMRYCYDHNIPVLASCFGFQIAVEEFGGKVIEDKANMEIGIYPIELNLHAKTDPLLFDYPQTFFAVSGHKERALRVPEECEVLGYSELCPYHIIKFRDKPFYGFQFHPEVDLKDLHTRISRYQSRYLESAAEMEAILQRSTQETPYANRVVKDFIDRVVTNPLEAHQ